MGIVLGQQCDTLRLPIHQTDGNYRKLDEVVAQQYPCCNQGKGEAEIAEYKPTRFEAVIDDSESATC
jgi:hypothetical protein